MAAPYLRQESDGRFTTLGVKITWAQGDENLIYFHDLIDAIESQLELAQGAVAHGVQDVSGSGSVEWNGESPSVHFNHEGPLDFVLPGEFLVSGNRVALIDCGNATDYDVTITSEGGETISGNSNLVLNSDYQSAILEAVEVPGSPSMEWVIISQS